jgi:hypothetical protein
VNILQEELVRDGVLPKEYDFEVRKELVLFSAWGMFLQRMLILKHYYVIMASRLRLR